MLLKEAFRQRYDGVEDDAVAKITGASDRPKELIRRYKNEACPNVAVTVDLLSTGVDVPAICNIVFLRRMNSRILYDQMIGRATRLCEPIGKDSFRIFDAVGIYEALRPFTDMQPVVVNPKISFAQLIGELSATEGEDSELVRDQLIAKLRRRQRHLSENAEAEFRRLTGEEPAAFISRLQRLPLAEARRWLGTIAGLGDLLDAKWQGPGQPQFVSEHGLWRGHPPGGLPGGVHGLRARSRQPAAGPHHCVAAALGTHPQGSSGAEVGPRSAGLQRSHPGHGLA
jgi:type I restriction enzyme R subunit